MKPVPYKKHWTQTGVDQITYYFASGCKVFPLLQDYYTGLITEMVAKNQLCYTPDYLLRRYKHDYLKRVKTKQNKVKVA